MATAAGNRTPAQLFALVFGAVYLLVGILGFFLTGFGDWTDKTGETLIIFPVNGLHNVVHVLLGIIWIGAAGRHETAKSVNMAFGVVLALVAVLGFAGVLEFLAIKDASSPDNFLHLVTAVLSIYFGSAGAAGPARGTAAI